MAKRAKKIVKIAPLPRKRTSKQQREIELLNAGITNFSADRMKLQGELASARTTAANNMQRAVAAETIKEQMEKRLNKMVLSKEDAIHRLKSQINRLLWVLNEDPDAEPDDVE